MQRKLFIYCNISLFIAALISGLSFVAQKLGMQYTGPFTFNTLRCLIGGISLLPLLMCSKSKCSIKGGILAGIILFIAFSINQHCMLFADAGKAGFITSLYIIFVPLFAVFLKQKLSINIKISIIIATVGLYLLCANERLQFQILDMFLLLSAVFFAMHILVLNHYSKTSDVIKLSIIQFMTAGILSLPFMLFLENPTGAEIFAGWKPILFIGVLVTGVAYTLQIFGQKATKPVPAALILSSEAVFAVLGGVLILNETLTVKEIFGCIIMLFGIIFSQIPNKSKTA